MPWKDVTSRSRYELKTEPRSWELQTADLRIVLTHHIHSPGKWVLKCEPFFRHLEFGEIGDDVDNLKRKAVDLIKSSLRGSERDLDEALADTTVSA